MRANVAGFSLIVALLAVFGCTANRPWRANLPVNPDANTERPANLPPISPTRAYTIETNSAFKIGYVEFDDQGWFWAHNQWKAVKQQISEEFTNDTQGLSIIVFVHGWKNNADYDNTNVCMFRSALTNLSLSLGPRKVFGVYVGWRGESIKSDIFPIPLGEEMSFYHRKDVAERIGHQGSATQVFTELEMMQDEFNQERKQPEARTELIIIGHSFGGQLVYSAISQIMIERLVKAARTKNKERVRSLGDMVILLNPAFEASLYNNLNALANSEDIVYPPDQAPVLAIFTSKSDWATGLAFPAGRHLSSWFEAKRPSHGDSERWLFNVEKLETKNEKAAIYESVGHDEDYLNFDLIYTNYGTGATTPVTSADELINPDLKPTPHSVLVENNSQPSLVPKNPYVFEHDIGLTNYAYLLQPRTNAAYSTNINSRNPFLNAAVDPRIMDGHNDITNPRMLQFLQDFILFSRTNYLEQRGGYLKQTLLTH